MTSTVLLVGILYASPWLGEYQLLEARTQLLTAMIMIELAIAFVIAFIQVSSVQGRRIQEQVPLVRPNFIICASTLHTLYARYTEQYSMSAHLNSSTG